MSITVYGQPDCSATQRVERTLDRENVTYDYVDVTRNREALNRMRDKGMETTPVIETPTDMHSGLDTKRLHTSIEQARDPAVVHSVHPGPGSDIDTAR